MKLTILVLTAMLSGRAMTLAFIHRAGGDGAGDPPINWLMPLIGDAVIGLSGSVVLALILWRNGPLVWTTIIAWNCLGIWDAMSAYIISITAPWPDFFMLQVFGGSMFFAASAMHLAALLIALRPAFRDSYWVTPTPQQTLQ